jgi:hypothetical protein
MNRHYYKRKPGYYYRGYDLLTGKYYTQQESSGLGCKIIAVAFVAIVSGVLVGMATLTVLDWMGISKWTIH